MTGKLEKQMAKMLLQMQEVTKGLAILIELQLNAMENATSDHESVYIETSKRGYDFVGKHLAGEK